jgi:hypothetical protein
MSVMMGLRVKVDPDSFEQAAQEKAEMMKTISERAKGMGCKAHRMYGGEGEILIVDEWDRPESFLEFFSSSQEIGEMMGELGVTEQPTPAFWRELDTPDRF